MAPNGDFENCFVGGNAKFQLSRDVKQGEELLWLYNGMDEVANENDLLRSTTLSELIQQQQLLTWAIGVHAKSSANVASSTVQIRKSPRTKT